MKTKVISKNLARYEIEWWKAHHRRDKKRLYSNLIEKYRLLHNISVNEARKAIDYFFKATREHDIAEELEDSGKIKESKKHWKNAETLLEKHFNAILAAERS